MELPFDINVMLLAGMIILGLVVIFLFSFFITYSKKQLHFKQDKALLQYQFTQEILKSRIEVQNTTLQQIGQELHDNIGQLLSVAKINLNILEETRQEEENYVYISQTNEIISQSISDLRILTKSLDGDFVNHFGLQESIMQELQRVRKTKKIQTEINLEGEAYTLGYEREILLFRIFQEFLNNSIKHSEAKNIDVKLTYGKDNFNLCLADNGKGFDPDKVMNQEEMDSSGAGLRSIKRRCELIGGKFKWASANGNGARLEIELVNDNEKINPKQI